MALTSRSLFFTLLPVVALHVPGIFARRGFGGSIHLSLNLGSVDSATFSFYIIFAVLTALQAIQAMDAMRGRRQQEDFPRRLLFIILTFVGILSLITSYALCAVLQSQINTITLTSLNYAVASSMISFTHMLTYIFLYAALLFLLDYRSTVQALQYGHSMSRSFVIALRAASAVLLLLMFVAALARAIIGSTQTLTYYFGQQEPLATRAYDGLYHLFCACNIVIAAVICGASVVLWTNRRPMDSQDDWLLFDTNVLSRIVKIICPLIVTHVIYELIIDIISWVLPQIWGPSFGLADIIIQGLLFLVVISVTLGLGFLPKSNQINGK